MDKYESHTRTAVRECFKGDEASQIEKAKIRPLVYRHTEIP